MIHNFSISSNMAFLEEAKLQVAGRDWGQEVMGMTEDEIFGWHH